MRLITERDVIKGFPQDWLTTYQNRDENDQVPWTDVSITFGEMRKRVLALDTETCTREDVLKSICLTSYQGWTGNHCHACNIHNETLMEFKDRRNGYTIKLCLTCLTKAIKLFPLIEKGEKEPGPVERKITLMKKYFCETCKKHFNKPSRVSFLKKYETEKTTLKYCRHCGSANYRVSRLWKAQKERSKSSC